MTDTNKVEPVAWMLPSSEGYDSAFRDHSTVKICTGNPWTGWIPLVPASALAALRQENEKLKSAFDDRVRVIEMQLKDKEALRQENEKLKEHAALRIDQVGESFRMENDNLRIQLAVAQDCVESLEAIKNRLTNDLNYMASIINVRNTALAEAQAERDLHYNRCASLLFSDVLRDTTTGDIRKLVAEYADVKSRLDALQQRHPVGGPDYGWQGEYNRGWNDCLESMKGKV